MSTTLQDIAREVGVSHAAVSMALRGTGRLREKTRRRICEVAERMGYRPNTAARATRCGRFGSIDLLLSTKSPSSLLPEALLAGVCDGLSEANLTLTLSRFADEKLTDDDYVPRILRELSADGLLINYNADVPSRMIELIQQHRLPSVWMNVDMDRDCVHGDDRAAAEELTRHLLERGRREIRYLGPKTGGEYRHYSKEDRLAGYADVMRQAGLEARPLLCDQHPQTRDGREELRQSMRAATQDGATPVVWIAYGHMEVVRLINHAVIDILARVPDQVALATFSHDARPAPMCVAEMVQPMRQVGRTAVDMLVEKTRQPNESLAPRTVPWTLRTHDPIAQYRRSGQ
jgi:LacI family transcriptional regulator